MTVRPISNYLYCKKIKQDQKTKSGIWTSATPDTNPIPQYAEVISVGDGVEQFKSGMKVVYKTYQEFELSNDVKDTFLISQDDIIAVLVK
jgi:co-chaperonin GroES (HSP10)